MRLPSVNATLDRIERDGIAIQIVGLASDGSILVRVQDSEFYSITNFATQMALKHAIVLAVDDFDAAKRIAVKARWRTKGKQ